MKNELGNTYGRLTVIKHAGSIPTNKGKSRLAVWLCSCECGMTTIVSGHNLRKGMTTSCGCYRREQLLKANTKHGDSPKGKPHARLYRIYYNIKTRCENPNFKEFEHYGGKGVRNRFESYAAFKEWAYSHGYYDQPEGTPAGDLLSIDRIDVNGPYSPENCRWISLSENTSRRNEDYWSRNRTATRTEGDKPRATTTG